MASATAAPISRAARPTRRWVRPARAPPTIIPTPQAPSTTPRAALHACRVPRTSTTSTGVMAMAKTVKAV